jgi:serine 3-dehydrogenase
MKLSNKTVLITGASSGIGRACAEICASEGARLILLARRRERLNEIASELRNKYESEIILATCDVRSRDQVENVISALASEWAAIDVLINNAGLSRGLDKIQDGDFENWDEMIDTNVKGLLYVSRAVLPLMIRRNDGIVVNIASIAGREVYPAGNVYCASKHAARAISKSMQLDLNGTGVRVCNIDPGLVETEFSLVRFHGDAERAEKVYQGYTPLQGNDVAEAMLFCITRPKHVSIHDILIMPTDQASTTLVNKKV